MQIADVFVFRCTTCGSRIHWQLSKAEIGIPEGEDPIHGKIYPFEKCSCGLGQFIQCENQQPQDPIEHSRPIQTAVKTKIDNAGYERLSLQAVHPNPKQPRRFFDKMALQSLADSIASIGLLEDILVRKDAEGYQIILGERRWRAAQMAGLPSISCKIADLTDEEAKLISLVENLQRENLTEVEEAFSFKDYIDRGISAKHVGDALGKLGDRVAGKLKLLNTQHYIKFQEERIEELTRDNQNLKAGLLALQTRTKLRYVSHILRSKDELLRFINDGWEYVAQLSREEFLVRRQRDDAPPESK